MVEFCPYCRKMTPYYFETENRAKIMNGQVRRFTVSVPVCTECGRVIPLEGMEQVQEKEISLQYAKAQAVGSAV